MSFKKALGYRLGALFAGISLACGVIVYAAPDFAPKIVEALTHSTWQFVIKPFDIVGLVTGAVLWGIIGMVIGLAYSALCGYIKED